MKNPLVSVIIPVFNNEKFILLAIDSIITQSYKNWEIIIVDDFSTDNTFKVVLEYISGKDNIFLFRNSQNRGVATTRNNAIKLAKGSYIAFLDSDDIFKEDKLEKQIFAMLKGNSDLCYSSYSFIDGNGNNVKKPYIVPETYTYNELLSENVIGLSTSLLKKELVEKNPFNPNFSHEDYVLWLDIFKTEGFKNIGLKEVLTYYRTGGRSKNKLKAAKNKWDILRNYENLDFFKAFYHMIKYFFSGIKKHY